MHGQRSQRSAVEPPVLDEVDTSPFFWLAGRTRAFYATGESLLAASTLPHMQCLRPDRTACGCR